MHYVVDFCADLWFNIHMLNVIDNLNNGIEMLIDGFNNWVSKKIDNFNDFLVDFLG